MSLPTEPQTWHRDNFTISTDKALLSIPCINAAFASDFMYWTTSVPDEILEQTIQNSFCFGLYNNKQQQQQSPQEVPAAAGEKPEQLIGFARLITDTVTFAYLTDVYVLPEYQGRGLGGWLLDCVDELLEGLPYLRWCMLRTSSERSKGSYEKRMGMSILACGDVKDGPVMMGKKGRGAVV